MASLDRTLRRNLENTVKQARRIAEAGARKALEELAVHHYDYWPTLSPDQRRLRNRLRDHGRQLGDRRDERRGVQAIDRLVGECAYEHWHRMLFARFLAENDLLIEPGTGVAITLAECQELARDGKRDWLEMASLFAVGMLPQIFRPRDPTLEVALSPETRSALEDLLKSLPREAFLADDSLGWVYQFWQAEQKEAVNKSETKIGADELPAVTQLFTEDYMVEFLLHNTLGAWWAGKVLAAHPEWAKSARDEAELRERCAVDGARWTYLRFVREGEGGPWRPAAGTFAGWPRAAREITLMDPCMGSGHFLVFALPLLAALRKAEEGLTEPAAIEAVLRDNLFGLEIDQRCTQIAAFNLALAAWRRVGYRPLPPLNLACSGLAIGVDKTKWLRLAEEAAAASILPPERDLLRTKDNLFSGHIKDGLTALYDLFVKAPWLGSLINPRQVGGNLLEAGFEDLEPLLAKILANGHDAELTEMAVAAQGMAKAAELLAKQFTLVVTNVPYLGRGKQDDILKEYCERVHPAAKADLATCFVERCLDFCSSGGSTALVTPQNWLFLTTFKKLRTEIFHDMTWDFAIKLGPAAFEDMNWWAAKTALVEISRLSANEKHLLAGLDVSGPRDPEGKAALLRTRPLTMVPQKHQTSNPDARLLLSELGDLPLLKKYAVAYQGIATGDYSRFGRGFWELDRKLPDWEFQQSTVTLVTPFGGREHILYWQQGKGELSNSECARIQGLEAVGMKGVAISQMNQLYATIFSGGLFDNNCSALVVKEPDFWLPVWLFCSSRDFWDTVRNIDQAVKVTNATLVKVPFDLSHWQKVAAEKYPAGLPKPLSDDPTQWLFNGHPKDSEQPLQVAVARLLGYRWPRQTGSSFPDCPALGPDGLESFADSDGIVCLPAINQKPPAGSRLRALLSVAFGPEWSTSRERTLLSTTGSQKTTLEEWLLDEFFEQHCALFHQRPFIWHLWDGRRDGFRALVNYHRLAASDGEGRRTLEKLIYTYLGDWIAMQRRDRQAGVEGADARVASAVHLQEELKRILAGEPPYDLFVRWKPLSEQPIGWEPDINDGIRMNIRPFMAARTLDAKAKNASILRVTPRIKWDKDRGKEPSRPKEDYPWFLGWDQKAVDFTGGRTFDGIRWNDLHYTNAFKQAARERRSKP